MNSEQGGGLDREHSGSALEGAQASTEGNEQRGYEGAEEAEHAGIGDRTLPGFPPPVHSSRNGFFVVVFFSAAPVLSAAHSPALAGAAGNGEAGRGREGKRARRKSDRASV
eukprot:scaffold57114_cov39-Tisochrysis_lutea.AAC.1